MVASSPGLANADKFNSNGTYPPTCSLANLPLIQTFASQSQAPIISHASRFFQSSSLGNVMVREYQATPLYSVSAIPLSRLSHGKGTMILRSNLCSPGLNQA